MKEPQFVVKLTDGSGSFMFRTSRRNKMKLHLSANPEPMSEVTARIVRMEAGKRGLQTEILPA